MTLMLEGGLIFARIASTNSVTPERDGEMRACGAVNGTNRSRGRNVALLAHVPGRYEPAGALTAALAGLVARLRSRGNGAHLGHAPRPRATSGSPRSCASSTVPRAVSPCRGRRR